MKKVMFERFISKYNLGGSCESVVYSVDGDTISTRSISDDKNVLCEVSAPSMGIQSGEFAVYETARLRSLLGVLGDNLTPTIQQSGDRATAMKFSDGSTDVTFVLADPSVIQNVPDLKKLPPFDMNIVLDDEFINKFVKAKSALADVETFTIMSDAGSNTADVVLGFSSMNTNRIKLSANKSDPSTSMDAISFSAKYLREILVANKDAGNGVLEISSKGLSRVTFNVDGINATYYLVQIDTKD